MGLKTLEQGKLYKQIMLPTRRGKDNLWIEETRTVMCVQSETWRSYTKVVIMIMGKSTKPVEDLWIDRFNVSNWAEDFTEITEEPE